MGNYIIRQNRLNDKQFIQFEAVASGRYALHSKFYARGNLAYFKAMQLSGSGEVCLWVNECSYFMEKKGYIYDNWYLLRRIKTEQQLSFDELYALAVQYV